MKKEAYSPEEIQKKFDSLPDDIKSAVYGADMLNLIQKLGQAYKLHVDQLDILEAETADVMTGFSRPEDFISNLSDSLSIDRAQAEAIAKDINDQLFVKIRESMKNLYTEKAPEALSAASSAPAPAVSTPVVPPPMPAAAPTPAMPIKMPEPHPADLMLTQKTLSAAPAAAPNTPPAAKPLAPGAPQAPATPKPLVQPQPYKADPYREPPE